MATLSIRTGAVAVGTSVQRPSTRRFSITEEAVEDNLYDSLSARYTKGLARAMAYTKQVKAASVLNNGFTGGVYAGGDGVALFSTAHPLISGGTNSNRPSTNSDLNETSLENAVIQIAAWTDEQRASMKEKKRGCKAPKETEKMRDTRLENIQKSAITRRRKVVCLNDGATFNSVVEAAHHYDVCKSTISAICRGKRNAAYGLKFKLFTLVEIVL